MATLKNEIFHSPDPSKLPAMFAALNELASKPVPVATALKIRRIRRVLQTQANDVEETRQEIVKRNGVEMEPGNFKVEPGTDGWEALQTEYRELMAGEFDVPEVLTAADLGSVEVSADTVCDLGALLTDE